VPHLHGWMRLTQFVAISATPLGCILIMTLKGTAAVAQRLSAGTALVH
jgi:hypothetical protein